MQINLSERANSFAQVELPDIDLRHLWTLTDDTGILHRARYAIPDRNHGYRTDDNARALIGASLCFGLSRDEVMLPLVRRYLGFLHHAFWGAPGGFREGMSYDRRWSDDPCSQVTQGWVIWSLGTAIEHLPEGADRALALELFERSLDATENFTSSDGLALTLLGLNRFLIGGRSDSIAEVLRLILAERLQNCHDPHGASEQPAEGLQAAALIESGLELSESRMLETGIGTLRRLVAVQRDGAGRVKTPGEMAALIQAALRAFQATGSEEWVREAYRCIGWFTGDNDAAASLYDSTTGGCRDGMGEQGVTPHQGAGATLSWLISSLTFHQVTRRGVQLLLPSWGHLDQRISSASAFVRTSGYST